MEKYRLPRLYALFAIFAVAIFLNLLAMHDGRADSLTITLDNPNLVHFYPNAQDPSLPAYYKSKKGFPQSLPASIAQFTTASLQRDGINASVSVSVSQPPGGNPVATITLSSDDPAQLKKAAAYATRLPAIMSASAAGQGWNGIAGCQSAAGCWDPAPGVSPWAFYLPLGLPMVNQKAVMLLNYPPSDALCSADYLSNFTMARWTSVLQTVGAPDPVLYETIVDLHPIAAPGSGQSGCIANTTKFFYAKGQPNYDQAMLSQLLAPAPGGGSTTIPLQVAGSDALAVWGSITGSTPKPGTVGTLIRAGQPAIPWVATNHPDVTSYQRCPGDAKSASGSKTSTGNSCSSGNSSGDNYVDDQLVQDELLDLQAACVLKTLADKPGTSPEDAQTQCKKVWCVDDSPSCRKQDVCVQARMDYDFTSAGHCKCQAAAQAFCAANNNNACPSSTSLTSCAPYNGACGSQPSTGYATCKSLTQ